MTVTIHNKLVGDKTAGIIEASGDVPVSRILKQDEYREALVAKLTAEAEELRSAAPDDRLENSPTSRKSWMPWRTPTGTLAPKWTSRPD